MEGEIEDIVQAYNEEAAAQRERLLRLYALMAARKGYREVRFGDHKIWMNSWDAPDRALEGMVWFITDVKEGIDE